MSKKDKAKRVEAQQEFDARRLAEQEGRRPKTVVDSKEPSLTRDFRTQVAAAVKAGHTEFLVTSAGSTVARIRKIAEGANVAPRPGELIGIADALKRIATGSYAGESLKIPISAALPAAIPA